MKQTVWQLDDQDVFHAPGLAALVFHNAYPEGKQGGIEIIQHGERILTCGDVRLGSAPTQWDLVPKAGDRVREADGLTVPGKFPEIGLAYAIRIEPIGQALQVTVALEGPLPDALVGRLGFNIEIYPGAYMGKTFWMDNNEERETPTHGIFPRQFNGPRQLDAEGTPTLTALAVGQRFVAAPEDPLRRFEVRSLTGSLSLYDGRGTAQNGWFVLREEIPSNAEHPTVVWLIATGAMRLPGRLSPRSGETGPVGAGSAHHRSGAGHPAEDHPRGASDGQDRRTQPLGPLPGL